VTSLTAKAASFFSCHLGMMGQSGPQDVACGVFICRCGVTTALAGEFRLRDTVLARYVPTGFATVGGVPGVDLNPSPPSLFRFGAQYRDELTPASVTYRSVKPGLRPSPIRQVVPRVGGIRDRLGSAQHVRDLQVLHDGGPVEAAAGLRPADPTQRAPSVDCRRAPRRWWWQS
jgi:hypothetical protein